HRRLPSDAYRDRGEAQSGEPPHRGRACFDPGEDPRLRARQTASPHGGQGRRGGAARSVPLGAGAAAQGGGIERDLHGGQGRPLRGTAMTIMLNHTIVPARDKAEAAKFFARIFGLKRGRTGYFAPVRVNKTLTLLFDDDGKFE